MSWAESDVTHMRAALAEAEKGGDAGEVPVGAVVIFDGDTIGAGHNTTISCRVFVDGALWHEEKVLLVAVANGETFGNGMRIAPGARPDDGEIDVVLIGPVPRWQLPFRLPQIYFGTHLGTRYVRAGRAHRVRLEPLTPLPPFDLDGEVFDSAPCDITVLPGALRFLF